MSNEPVPATPPDAEPSPSCLPELKKSLNQKAEAKSGNGRESLYSAVGTVALLAAGIGWGLWNARQDAQEAAEVNPPDVRRQGDELARRELERQGKFNQARTAIKNSIQKAGAIRWREEAEAYQKLLITTEKLAKLTAPDLLPEIQQARQELELGLQQNRFPKLADRPRPKAGVLPVAPPPREVKR